METKYNVIIIDDEQDQIDIVKKIITEIELVNYFNIEECLYVKQGSGDKTLSVLLQKRNRVDIAIIDWWFEKEFPGSVLEAGGVCAADMIKKEFPKCKILFATRFPAEASNRDIISKYNSKLPLKKEKSSANHWRETFEKILPECVELRLSEISKNKSSKKQCFKAINDSAIKWDANITINNENWRFDNLFFIYKNNSKKLDDLFKKHLTVNLLNILHLSDLHFKANCNNSNLWLTQLISDLKDTLQCTLIDYLIISGDIANCSYFDEYELAEHFINELCEEFKIQKSKIIIVPGNHDVSYDISKKSYLAPSIIDKEQYKKRFYFFKQFYKTITNTEYSEDYDNQYTIKYEPKNNILFLGLNSSWEIDHINESRININTMAFNKAMAEIRKYYQKANKILICHHPINEPFLEVLSNAGFKLLIHGHCHRADNKIYNYCRTVKGKSIEIVAAGTFGASTKELFPAYPWQYNFMKMCNNDKIVVETRKREEENGPWKPDARWNVSKGDPKPRYTINLK